MTEKNKNISLECEGCHGKLSLPENLESATAECPYCGQQNVLPEKLVRSRRERLQKQQKAKRQASQDAARAREQKATRRARLIKALIAAVVIIVCVIAFLVLSWIFRDKRPKDPAYTGQNTVMQWMANLQSQGCTHVVSPPEVVDRQVSWDMTMQSGGSCLYALAATGTAQNILTVDLKHPSGQSVPAPPPGNFNQLLHCPKVTGTYVLSFTPSTDYYYTYAVVDCPRDKFDKKRAEDPISTGQSQVAARMKQLYKKGCKHIVHPAERGDKGFEWTATFAKGRRANCLHILVYTGTMTNTLTATMTTPFGESVPTSPPGTAIDFRYCSKTGGPHKFKLIPKTDDYYTFAAVDCPRGK